MSTLLEVRAGIKTAFQTIVEASDVERASVMVPSAVVLSPPLSYWKGGAAGAGAIEVRFPVLVNVGAQIIDESSRLLTEIADTTGDRSFHLAVMADQTLGGTVDNAILDDFRPFGIEEYAAVGYWGGLFTIEALWRRG